MLSKPKTYFIDIDGVLMQHLGMGLRGQMLATRSFVKGHDPSFALEENIRVLNQLEGLGHHIILVTARPENCRADTEAWLERMCVPAHRLIMEVTSGERVIVNDMKPGGQPTARAVVVERNRGLKLEEL